MADNEIKFDEDVYLQKLRKELVQSWEKYKQTIKYLACDAPIEILCLPKEIENILISNNFLRIYDLFDLDFTKIEGIGVKRARDLTSRLNQFLSML